MAVYTVIANLTGEDGVAPSRTRAWICQSPVETRERKQALIGGGIASDIEVRRNGAKIADEELERDINNLVRAR